MSSATTSSSSSAGHSSTSHTRTDQDIEMNRSTEDWKENDENNRNNNINHNEQRNNHDNDNDADDDKNNVGYTSIEIPSPQIPTRQHTPRIRALLDPTVDNQGRSIFGWDEEHLDRLVDAIEPQHLGIAVKARQRGRLEEPSHILSWHHLTYTSKQGIKLLDDVSGMLLPGMLVGLIGAPDSGYVCLCLDLDL